MTDSLENLVLIRIVIAVQCTRPMRNVSINREMQFTEDLGIDNVDVARIARHLEELFGVNVSSEAVVHFRTVADMVSYFSSRFFQTGPADNISRAA